MFTLGTIVYIKEAKSAMNDWPSNAQFQGH